MYICCILESICCHIQLTNYLRTKTCNHWECWIGNLFSSNPTIPTRSLYFLWQSHIPDVVLFLLTRRTRLYADCSLQLLQYPQHHKSSKFSSRGVKESNRPGSGNYKAGSTMVWKFLNDFTSIYCNFKCKFSSLAYVFQCQYIQVIQPTHGYYHIVVSCGTLLLPQGVPDSIIK